ncbi:MAG: YlmC/YmxH family sporulation protein [Bacilli bacterium]|nr:YlmC/YmxH family sporulation protein [Bacilli bacterium]
MRLSELQHKDVINIKDGKKIGNIIDINIGDSGTMNSLIVERSKFFVSFFSSSGEIEIKWDQIEKIGEDVILVSLNQ